MSWEHDIAKRIKQPGRKTDGYFVAKVVAVNPTKLSLFDGEIYITENMMDKTDRFETLERISGEERLKIGDRVGVVGYQRFLIIDRVV